MHDRVAARRAARARRRRALERLLRGSARERRLPLRAHEQAKWSGDDIALRSGKYDHDLRSLRAAATTMRLVGSGNPPLHRFRVGLEFAISGRRDFDGMIARHAFFARPLAERLGLSSGSAERRRRGYEFWDGKGWPDGLRARRSRSPHG
jgi:hypothetical protein